MTVFTCEAKYIPYYLALRYADGYPTTEGETIRAIVQSPEDIAEDSSITCGLSECDGCPIIGHTDCKEVVWYMYKLNV